MIEFLKRYNILTIMLLMWLFVGIYTPPNASPTLVLIPFCVLLFKFKNRYRDIYIGFLFILAMSDNWLASMGWTTPVRNIYIVLLSVFYFFNKDQFPYPNKLYLAFVPFLIWSFILVYRNDEPMNAFMKSLSYTLTLIVVPGFFIKLLNEEGTQFLRDIVFFIAWLLLIGMILFPVLPDVVMLAGRYRGVLGNPNGIGTFSFVFTTFFYIINEKFPGLFSKRERIWIYLLIFISLLWCESRNGLMSILIFFLFVRFYRLSSFAGFALFVVLLVGFQLISQNLTEIITALGLGERLRVHSLENGSGRLVAWIFAWGYIKRDLFVGRGFDFDSQIFIKYKVLLGHLGHNGGIHNVFLGMWMCFGLVGVILYYQALLRTVFKAAHISPLAVPLLYGTIFSTSFEAWLMGSINPFTTYFLMSLILLTYEPEHTLEKESLVPV